MCYIQSLFFQKAGSFAFSVMYHTRTIQQRTVVGHFPTELFSFDLEVL